MASLEEERINCIYIYIAKHLYRYKYNLDFALKKKFRLKIFFRATKISLGWSNPNLGTALAPITPIIFFSEKSYYLTLPSSAFCCLYSQKLLYWHEKSYDLLYTVVVGLAVLLWQCLAIIIYFF